ncbi:hypothetical protein GOBAR_AA04800 [Gossypium barbadense]|uniref:Uncharacterized protein n=1 Tax=Gossypium barbadense TaxID=3634 RepID=A0A2P5YJN4_GOSBA|nr:hypothetical protein GOBAR_AA04800 [Gossypium barbadense]
MVVGNEEPGDSFSAGSFLPMAGGRSQITNKVASKGGWKLNKTFKGPGNRFKLSEKPHVSLTDSMKKAAILITSEIEEYSAKNLSRRPDEIEDNSSSVRQ